TGTTPVTPSMYAVLKIVVRGVAEDSAGDGERHPFGGLADLVERHARARNDAVAGRPVSVVVQELPGLRIVVPPGRQDVQRSLPDTLVRIGDSAFLQQQVRLR